jgi:acyl-CoA reductase-like NAD-dependent aldehyde dehydrogenase
MRLPPHESRLEAFRKAMTELGLGDRPQSLIDGELVDGAGAMITLVDPSTAGVLTEYPDAGSLLAQSACEAARRAQKRWMAERSAQARGQLMQDIAATVRAHAEPLSRLEAVAAGKPIRDCRVEVAKVAEMFAYYAGWADKQHGEVIPVPSGTSTTRCENR